MGLNALDINLAINTSPLPNFRAYSAGGINSQGQAVTKDPDLETHPTGGFNPSAGGAPTQLATDNSVYIGQIDYVTRVSRAHTIFFDSGSDDPDYVEVVPQVDLPPGTSIQLAYRSASAFNNQAIEPSRDARRIDPYGRPDRGFVNFVGDGSFSPDLDDADGGRYLQIRISLINDVDSGRSPVLKSLGVAYLPDAGQPLDASAPSDKRVRVRRR